MAAAWSATGIALQPGDARRVYDLLRGRGYDNLSVLEDGFDGWARRGLPVER